MNSQNSGPPVQRDYEGYWSNVTERCKDLDAIGRYADLRDELRKSSNKKGEFSLPYLYNRRDINASCLTARSTRENSCWKEKIDSGHQKQIDDLKEALRFTEDLINESIRNGKAYTVDRAHFDDLSEDEEDNCDDMDDDFKWLSDIEDDEKVDCGKLASLIDRVIDCKEVRKEIVGAFKDGASTERKNALKEVEAFQAEAERTLTLKKDNKLCE